MNNLRTISKTIKFTNDEIQELELEASKNGFKLSSYLRSIINNRNKTNDYSTLSRKINNIVLEYNSLVKSYPQVDTVSLEYAINDAIFELAKGGK